MYQNFKIVECHDHIGNKHETYLKMIISKTFVGSSAPKKPTILAVNEDFLLNFKCEEQ